jgi:hypothetical protein
MSQSDWLGVLALKLVYPKRLVCQSVIAAFLSTDGIKCDIHVFRAKNRLSHYPYLWSFEGYLRKYCGLFCVTEFTHKKCWHF